MWQKLSRIDSVELEKARIQLLNAIQLVCSPPRCYIDSKTNKKKDWLYWDEETRSIQSTLFGNREKIRIALDIEQFVLSIIGAKDHVEHLVLSGITYPMAFGWLKIKLDSFDLKGDLFTDHSEYEIEGELSTDEELNISSQKVFEDLAIYYSNARYLLELLAENLEIEGIIQLDPSNLQLELTSDKSNFIPGFSPGNRRYPEPYFYIQLNSVDDKMIHQLSRSIGIWNNKEWQGLVLLASEFFTLETDVEKNRVFEFFTKNYWRLNNH